MFRVAEGRASTVVLVGIPANGAVALGSSSSDGGGYFDLVAPLLDFLLADQDCSGGGRVLEDPAVRLSSSAQRCNCFRCFSAR